jgi:hypothetical protein
MVDEYIINIKNDSEEGFVRLEAQVFNISRNMSILMSTINSNSKPFGEIGNSN